MWPASSYLRRYKYTYVHRYRCLEVRKVIDRNYYDISKVYHGFTLLFDHIYDNELNAQGTCGTICGCISPQKRQSMINDLQNRDVMSFSASTKTGNIDLHSDATLDSS